eukprot:jgi/Galph1/742/GphlegSOOS_G5497.1
MSQDREELYLGNYGSTKLPEGISSYSEGLESVQEDNLRVNGLGGSSERYKPSIPGVSEVSAFEEIREERLAGTSNEVGISAAASSRINESQQETRLWADDTTNLQLFTTPLEPNQELSLRDRITLIWGSAKPWRDFFDLRSFSMPSMDNLSNRIQNNLQHYLYNYIVCLFVFCLVLFLFHPIGTISFSLLTALCVFLFLLYPGATDAGIIGIVTPTIKIIFVSAIALLFLLFFGLGRVVLDMTLMTVLLLGSHVSLSSRDSG